MNVLARAIRFLRNEGVGALPAKTLRFVDREWIQPRMPRPLARRRRLLGKALFERSRGVVLCGPLAGFQLNTKSNWGGAAYGPMILGTYEANVMDRLLEWSKSARFLIDIGAADGYFGVGLIACGHFERAACFEIDSGSRDILRNVAALNGVADRVEIFGTADTAIDKTLAERGIELEESVLLCDIEGAEFDLLSPEFLSKIQGCKVIIELHEDYFPDASSKLERLLADAGEHFEVSFLAQGARQLSDHDFVRQLAEDERWLLCSEGRGIDQRWLVLEPKNNRDSCDAGATGMP